MRYYKFIGTEGFSSVAYFDFRRYIGEKLGDWTPVAYVSPWGDYGYHFTRRKHLLQWAYFRLFEVEARDIIKERAASISASQIRFLREITAWNQQTVTGAYVEFIQNQPGLLDYPACVEAMRFLQSVRDYGWDEEAANNTRITLVNAMRAATKRFDEKQGAAYRLFHYLVTNSSMWLYSGLPRNTASFLMDGESYSDEYENFAKRKANELTEVVCKAVGI